MIMNMVLFGVHVNEEFNLNLGSHCWQTSFLLQDKQFLPHFSHLSTNPLFFFFFLSAGLVASNHFGWQTLHLARDLSHLPHPSNLHFLHFPLSKKNPKLQTVHSLGCLHFLQPGAHLEELELYYLGDLEELPEDFYFEDEEDGFF